MSFIQREILTDYLINASYIVNAYYGQDIWIQLSKYTGLY